VYQYVLAIVVCSVCVLNDYILQFSIGTYGGDIYDNMLIMIGGGCLAILLAFALINNLHPALALAVTLAITLLPGFSYFMMAHFSLQKSMSATVFTVLGQILLCMAKLGATAAHSLAYLFIVWQFKSSQTSFVLASSNLSARVIACLAPLVA